MIRLLVDGTLGAVRGRVGKTGKQASQKAGEEQRPDERILSLLLLLLDARRPVSRAEIFAAIAAYRTKNPAAGERKFERDKKDLRELGVPIQVPEDDPDFYAIDRHAYELPPVTLDDDERAGLVLAAEALRGQEGLVYRDLVEEALRKLSFDGGMLTRAYVPSHLAISLPPRQRSGRLNRTIAEIGRAVEARKRLTIAYKAYGEDSASERMIDPYALVYSGGDWQLIGHCHLRNAPRTFRVDRIDRLRTAGKPGTPDFERPPDWSLATYVQRSPWVFEAGTSGGVDVVLDIGPERTWIADEDFGPSATRESIPARTGEGEPWVRVRFRSGNPGYIVTRVLDAAGHIRVVEPVDLRARVRKSASAVAAVYGAAKVGGA